MQRQLLTLTTPPPRSRRFLLLLWLIAPFASTFAGDDRDHASAKALTLSDTWSLPGILGSGLKGNDAYIDGSFFLTVPVWSSIGRDGILGDDTLFLEPYVSWGEEGEVAASLGLGWRHLFCDQSISAVTHHDGHQAAFLEE